MEGMDRILSGIKDCLKNHESIAVAIDGRCGAGKTTLAARLQQQLPCQVVHMDDFFLRPCQRTPERSAQPGENVDHERFLEEVLKPWQMGIPFSYCPYDCHTQSLSAPVSVTPGQLLIVEGSYACHEALWQYYALHIFLDVGPVTQAERILARNGAEAARVFREKWIPLEEAYFSAANLQNRCEFYIME